MSERIQLFKKLGQVLSDLKSQDIIVKGGDWNSILNFTLDLKF